MGSRCGRCSPCSGGFSIDASYGGDCGASVRQSARVFGTTRRRLNAVRQIAEGGAIDCQGEVFEAFGERGEAFGFFDGVGSCFDGETEELFSLGGFTAAGEGEAGDEVLAVAEGVGSLPFQDANVAQFALDLNAAAVVAERFFEK